MRIRIGKISPTRRGRSSTPADDVVVRDAEESLVAALHESDTVVETMHDHADDDPDARRRTPWVGVGAAGLLVALLGLMVARRRN